MNVYKTNDEFLWLDVTDMAHNLWQAQDFELYAIYNDHSDHLINTQRDFEDAIKHNCIIAIELDFINNIKPLN